MVRCSRVTSHWRIIVLVLAILILLVNVIYRHFGLNIRDTIFAVRSTLQKGSTPENRLRCDYHEELCWLRKIITHKAVYNLPLSGNDKYDFRELYKYKDLTVLSDLRFHGPTPYKHDLSKRKEVAWMESVTDILEVNYQKKNYPHVKKIGSANSDFLGRTCSLDYKNNYLYKIQSDYIDGFVSVVLTEIPLAKSDDLKLPNHLQALVVTPQMQSACVLFRFEPAKRKYTLRCPVYEQNYHIVINVTYFDITSHQVGCEYTGFPVAKISSKDLEKKQKEASAKDVLKWVDIFAKAKVCMKKITGEPPSPGLWLKKSGQWHWFQKDCYYNYDLTPAQSQCIKNTSLVLIGDSHSKNRFDALQVYKFRSLDNQQSHMAMHLVARLQDWLNMYKNSRERIDWLALNTGQHDLAFLNPVYYIAYMEEVLNLITQIQKLERSPQIVWIQTTPVEKLLGMEGNRLIRALNDWTWNEMRRLGVKLVPAYDVMIAMPGHTRDGFHQRYATRMTSPNGGHVGGAIVSMLVHTLCSTD